MHARVLEQKPLICVVLLCAMTLAVYANSFDGAFVFDDQRTIVDNKQIEELFDVKHLQTRRPVVRATLALNYAFGERNPWGYHLVNLLIHLMAGMVLFDLVRRTIPRASSTLTPAAARIAFVSTLWWLVHPLQTESVTYVIQRAESLMGLFYLGTLYCTLRSVDGRRPRTWQVAAVACCALGMASKAVIVTAPLAVLLFDRLFLAGSLRDAWRARKTLYVALAGTFGVLLLTGVLVSVLGWNRGQIATVGFAFSNSADGVSPLAYLSTQPAAILHYLRLTVWPMGQCVDYSWTVAEARSVAAMLLLAALAFASVLLLRKRPQVGFLPLFFFLVLAPTSSFIPIRDLVFEHRMYLPLAALTVLATVTGTLALGRWCPGRAGSGVAMAVVLSVAGALGATTAVRNEVYSSPLSFWQDVVHKRPDNARGHEQLAQVLFDADRPAEAWPHLERAYELQPQNVGVGLRIAELHMREQRLDAALPFIDQAVSFFESDGDRGAKNYFKPKRAHAFCLKGAALLQQQQPAAALPYFAEGLRANPRFVDGLLNQALALASLQRFPEADKQLARALRNATTPFQTSEALELRSAIALARKDLPQAKQLALEALQSNPQNQRARLNLARVAALTNDYDTAAQWADEVLAAEPQNAEARQLRAAIRTQQKAQ